MPSATEAPASPRTAVIPTVRSLELKGPAGRLEALLNTGARDAEYAAVICHPHPLGGGTMHNKVVFHAMKVLNDPAWGFGLPVLRFNFRGTGLSEGAHHGADEAADARTAIDWIENEYKLPVIAAGFSFGAAMALAACCQRPQPVRALALLGLPTHASGREYRYPALKDCTLPKLMLSGDRDQFAPAAELRETFASAAEPRRLALIAGADHFFSGHIEAMQSALAGWLKEQLPWRR